MRITSLAVANAVGNKLAMFVTGKAKKPRCFKNVKFFPVVTEINEKYCLKSGSKIWTRNLFLKQEKSL